MQALAIYAYDQDGMAVAGQIFFPVLFTLMALYLMMRNPGGSAKQLVVVVLELAVFAVTMVGVNQKNPYLYPSIIVYYASFAVLALEVAVRIAEMPKKVKVQDDSEDPESSDQDAPAEGSDDAASVKPMKNRAKIFGGNKTGRSWAAACPSSTRYALGGEGEAA